jgi:hypothetical protein
MNMPIGRRQWTVGVLAFLAVLMMQGCPGCPPIALKTIEVRPKSLAIGRSGVSGSMGWCLSAGHPPPSPFSAAKGQVMVGFDDYYKSGTAPFPCDDIRAVVFRGGVLFDLGAFDSVVSADLLFDTQNSINRSNGETIGQSPPASYATTLGVGTKAFTNELPDDNEASIAGLSGVIDVGVTNQVRDWVTSARPNFGFVIWGPRGLVNPSSPPKDNDATISWYGNFRLRIVYNPASNPRAPQ